jgi:hypothetical protein
VAMNADDLAAADRCLAASLPRIDDALALLRRVWALADGRLVADPYGGDDPLWYVADPALPGWVVAPHLVAVDLDIADPGPPQFADPVHQEWFERSEAEEAARRPPMLPSRLRRTGRVELRLGPAVWQVTYGADGLRRETMRSERPAVAEGLGELPAEGLPLEELAGRVAALDAARFSPVRVFAPDPVPGGVGGVRWRALECVRTALCGPLPLAGGWVVADGVRGSVWAAGPTPEAAAAAFEEAVRGVEIVPEPPPRPVALAEPTEPVSTTTVDEDGTRHISASATIVFGPKTRLPWPPPGSRPCRALFPVPGPVEVPPAWAGFGRVVGLLDDDGRVGWALLRGDDRAGRLVGEAVARRWTPDQVEGSVQVAVALLAPWPRAFQVQLPPDGVHRLELAAPAGGGELRFSSSGCGGPLALDRFEPTAAERVVAWGPEEEIGPRRG